MTDGIIAYNRTGEVILTNPAAEKLLKSKAADIVSFDEFMSTLGIKLNMGSIISDNKIIEPFIRCSTKINILKFIWPSLRMKIIRQMV